MTHYQKGAKFERELVNKFWEHGWGAIRAAGSGGVAFPVPDVIAIKNNDIIIVECKSTKKDRLSLKKAAMNLKKFADISKGRAYIAIKFYKKKPRFFDIHDLLSGKTCTVNIHDKYLEFETILGEQMIFM